MGKGQFTLISASEPYVSLQSGALASHILFIPGDLMRTYKVDIEDHAAKGFTASSMRNILIEHAFSICQNIIGLDAGDIEYALHSLLNILVTLIDQEDRRYESGAGNLVH